MAIISSARVITITYMDTNTDYFTPLALHVRGNKREDVGMTHAGYISPRYLHAMTKY